MIIIPQVDVSYSPDLKKLFRIHWRGSFKQLAIDFRIPFRHPGLPKQPWWRI